MKTLVYSALLLCLLCLALASCSGGNSPPAPTATATPMAAATVTPIATTTPASTLAPLLLGLLLAGAYEVIALVNTHVPFTSNLPLITSIVRPWVIAHKPLALGIAMVIFASFGWLFYHFGIAG